jgi:3',5'-nucleoside bisphosphate phosphatase
VNRFLVDLHVHTALSPCAETEMTPPAIVREACGLGLQIIAICDHNTAGNARAVQTAAEGQLVVLAGMEIMTTEEVHVLGIFPTAQNAEAAGEEVRKTLPDLVGGARRFGDQSFFNATGQIIGAEVKMLSMASGFSLEGAIEMIKRHGGLGIAAHIDRPSYSVLSQLGFFPPGAEFDAVEVTRTGLASPQAPLYTSLELPIITSSDSHRLTDLGICYSMLEMQNPSFEEIALTLKGIDGRRIYHSA